MKIEPEFIYFFWFLVFKKVLIKKWYIIPITPQFLSYWMCNFSYGTFVPREQREELIKYLAE